MGRGCRKDDQVSPSPAHTCISEPLDKPRALASSVVRPFFSVRLTADRNRKYGAGGEGRAAVSFCAAFMRVHFCSVFESTHVISGWRGPASFLEVASADRGPEWPT